MSRDTVGRPHATYSRTEGRWKVQAPALHLPAVAQAGRDTVDTKMNALHDARIGVARPMAPQQFDLHMVERIDVGKAVADRARQQGIALQQRLLPRDGEDRVDRRLPLL